MDRESTLIRITKLLTDFHYSTVRVKPLFMQNAEAKVIVKKFYHLFGSAAANTLSKSSAIKINSIIAKTQSSVDLLGRNQLVEVQSHVLFQSNIEIKEILSSSRRLHAFCAHFVESLKEQNNEVFNHYPNLLDTANDIIGVCNAKKEAEAKLFRYGALFSKFKKITILTCITFLTVMCTLVFELPFKISIISSVFVIAAIGLFLPETRKKFFFLLAANSPLALNFANMHIQVLDNEVIIKNLGDSYYVVIWGVSYLIFGLLFYGKTFRDFILNCIAAYRSWFI